MSNDKFRTIVNETGFLTVKGREVANKTLVAGLDAFFQEMGTEALTLQQRMLLKSILLSVVSDNLSYRPTT